MDNTDLFTCIDHVAVAYPNREDAVAYCVEKMGWHLLHQEENEDQGVAEAMLSPVADPAPTDTKVQIVAPIRDDAAVAKWLTKNRPGLHHMAWRVKDIDAVSAVLRERGFVLLYDEPRHGTSGSRINFVHPKSANGVLTELVEPAK
jgi:methylmalonyl-CoA/ethylmalonyl-CoA epimerase